MDGILMMKLILKGIGSDHVDKITLEPVMCQ